MLTCSLKYYTYAHLEKRMSFIRTNLFESIQMFFSRLYISSLIPFCVKFGENFPNGCRIMNTWPVWYSHDNNANNSDDDNNEEKFTWAFG